jgi:16S rRNA C967 or C1407 C5-methylase (RsmB/RsmF family)
MPKTSSAQHPPPDFLAKKAGLLGNEYDAFVHNYAQPGTIGLRVNTLKIAVADFISKAPFALSAVGDYAPAGFHLSADSKPGRHPYHAAGLYYLQEPAAMSVAQLLRPLPGELVLDLAAASGGKATHLASLMDDTGLLVANDVNRGRAKILAGNMER